MKKLYLNHFPKAFVFLIFSIFLNIHAGYSTINGTNESFEDSLRSEQKEFDTKDIETVAGIDSASLKTADTTAAGFSGLSSNYCPDNAAVFPISFSPPNPPPERRTFLRVEGNGVTPTGKYSANFTPSVKGKYKVNYIVRDSIFYDDTSWVFQPKEYDSKSGGHVSDGCDCFVVIHNYIYQGMEDEKVGYSSSDIVVSIGNFNLPSLVCVSDAPIDLSLLVDPSFSTGLTGTQFSITSATSSYNPAVLAGTIFDPGLVTATNTFTIRYDYFNPLGCSDFITRDIIVTSVPEIPTYTTASLANTSPCQYTAAGYAVNSAVGVTSYQWVLPGGWTGTSTSSTIATHSSSTAGSIITRAVNICGTSADATLVVTPNSIPDIPDIASGPANPCKLATASYTTNSAARATSYTWSIPSDWSGTSTTNSISTTVGNTAGSISVTAVNACGSSSPSSSYSVTTNSPPAQPDIINGTANVTQSTTGNQYNVTVVPNTTSYNWTYSGLGATFHQMGTSGRRTGVDFSSTATSGTLSVTTTNACGTSAASTLELSMSPSVVNQPAEFTASEVEICRGQSGVIYTIPNDASVSYTWAYSGTGAIITGTGNSVTIDFSSIATDGTLSVTAMSGTTSSAPRALTLDVKSIPSSPGTITGSLIPYEGISTTYSVTEDLTETESYTWTLPSGWVGSSAINTITATPNATAGAISVTANNYCGSSAASTLTGIVPGIKPSAPGIISGPDMVDQSSSGNTYSISAVPGATIYHWLYSDISGATIVGTGTSITLNFSATAEDLGILSVTAENAYGISSSSSKNISVAIVSAVTNAFSEKFILSTFPNPYTETAVIRVSAPASAPITLSITDLLGHTRTIVTDYLIQDQEEFDMPELESGVYFLTLYAKGELYINRIVRIR